jgi:putative flippase GtrA
MLAAHPLTGDGLRYASAGGLVALVYLAIPVGLNGILGVPLEAAIPLAYVIAVTLHFNLQRHFVFRRVTPFALSRRQQILRYVLMGAIQYPITAVATALLPKLLGFSERVTFVVVTVVMSLTFFLVLRTHIFHAHGSPSATRGARLGSADELEVGERQLL